MTDSPRGSRSLLTGFGAIAAAVILTLPAIAAAQGPATEVQAPSANAPKIWEDRGPIERLDLYWGNGSPDRVPVGPFTFVAEDLGGSNPKARVRDVQGVLWKVKWDEEAQSEVAASRLAWAMGLRVDEVYHVTTGAIVFAGPRRPTLQRIGPFIDGQGNLKSGARFERNVPEQTTRRRWAFDDNPLRGEGGYSVLVLMNVVLANWDAKNSNNRILSVPDTMTATDWYMVGDYGTAFGKMGRFPFHSKYDLKEYVANPPVVRSIEGDTVHLAYKGKNGAAHASVPLEGARFFASRAAALTLAQVEDAFRAANVSEQDLHGFADAVYSRIHEVVTKLQ